MNRKDRVQEMVNAVNSKWYKEERAGLEKYYTEDHLIKTVIAAIDEMPERYRVEVSEYETGGNSWHVLKIRVIDTKDNRVVDIKRNYSSVAYRYCEQRGKGYLITGEDYQGFTIVDLEKMESASYVPEAAKEGNGWCPLDFLDWNEDKNELVVEGCFWACPYTKRIYEAFDFENPDFDMYTEIDADD